MLFCFPVASLFTYNLLFKAISRSNYIDSKWEKAQVGLRVVGYLVKTAMATCHPPGLYSS